MQESDGECRNGANAMQYNHQGGHYGIHCVNAFKIG